MINCPECGKEVSDTAVSCPNCGYDIRKELRNIERNQIYQDIYNNVEMPTQPKTPSLIGIIIDLCFFVIAIIIAAVCGIILYTNSNSFSEVATSLLMISILVMVLTVVILITMYSSYKEQKKEYDLSINDPETYRKKKADEKMEYVRLPSEKSNGKYTFHYLASFFIPIVGFILGAMLLSKDDELVRDKGKNCIWLGVASVIITFLLVSKNII